MSVVTRPASVDSRAEHALRTANALVAVFLGFTLPATIAAVGYSASVAALIVHVGTLSLAFWVATGDDGHEPNLLRDWLPLLAGPYLYVHLRWVIDVVGRPHLDVLVQQWETSAFPSDPSHSLASRFGSVAASELLHLAYLSYYALIYVPPAILYWRHHRRVEFAATMFALVIVYAVCFAAFIFFPVDGPRFVRGAAAAPHGPVRSVVLALLESGSSRGTAFPSSHVAASVVASLCALRFQRRVGVVVTVATAGIAVGAVYGGFHYAVDVVAGLAVGVVSYVLAMKWFFLRDPGLASSHM